MKKILLLLFSISLLSSLFAQKKGEQGLISYKQDERIQKTIYKKTEINKKQKIKGYRVKIHFGTDKTKAKEIKSNFITKYNNVPAYDDYQQPNFTVTVGDFRTKLEAYKFWKEISPQFPGSFIVQQEIELPKQ